MLISIVVDGIDCTRAAERIDLQMRINLRNGIRHVNFGLDLRREVGVGVGSRVRRGLGREEE